MGVEGQWKKKSPFNRGRELPAGGTQKWLGKVTASEWLLCLRVKKVPGGAVEAQQAHTGLALLRPALPTD